MSLTPYLTVSDAAGAIKFYQEALGATLVGQPHTMPNSSKIMHAHLMLAGGAIMLADDFSDVNKHPSITPQALGGSPVQLALEVDDAQTLWDKAIAAGSTVQMPLAKQFWGALYGNFTDPYGHRWSVSQTLQQMTDEEMTQAAEELFKEKGTVLDGPAEEAAA